jgi:cytochrome P450
MLSDIETFTFGGHDTTGLTFCFFLMEMGRHPEVRRKLQEELRSVMPSHPLGSPKPDDQNGFDHGDNKLISAICGLEYLNCCIKEVMRLWPVTAVGSGREVHEDLTWNGMVISKGSIVSSYVHSMFRERWIDRPHDFIPERWLAGSSQLTELNKMFIPFNVGKRACIGQNMAMFQLRIIAAYYMHYFDFELVGEPSFAYFLTLKPESLNVKATERKNI